MSTRAWIFGLFVITVLLILHIERSTHSVTRHTPAQAIKLSANSTIRPYYTTGPLRNAQIPKPTLFDRLSRKKIDNFIFNHYNHYKMQFTFVDLGYASHLMFSFFSEQYPAYRITQKIGFDLSQNMIDGTLNLDIHKKNFNLVVRQEIDTVNDQTITTFNVSLHRKDSDLSANLTHIIRNKQCFTAVRTNRDVISHKCFGGIGSGKTKIDRVLKQGQQYKKQSNMLNPTFNLTRVLYDGLRGSGMHWKWVWGEMSGFSKAQFYTLNHTIGMDHWIGINFGYVFGEGEDFAFIDGKIIPIEGIKYEFNQKVKIGTNITLTATKPRIQANFTVLSVDHQFEDLGVIKQDMVKAEGNWAGWIQRQDGKKYEFYLIAGLIESCDSLF